MSLEADEETQIETELDEAANAEEEGGEEIAELDTQADEDGIVIEIDGVDAAQEDNLVKRLRAELREAKRQIHASAQAAAPKKIEVGNKPDLWDDCEGDADKFERELSAYHDRVRQREQQDKSEQEQQEAGRKRFETAHAQYRQHAQALGVAGYDAIEEKVQGDLPPVLRDVIPLYFGDKGPKVVVALGRHPQLLDELLSIQDPLAQILKLNDIAHGVKIMPRKAPPPESQTIQRGSAPAGGTSDKELARLEKEAERTGNRTQLIEYRRKMKAA